MGWRGTEDRAAAIGRTNNRGVADNNLEFLGSTEGAATAAAIRVEMGSASSPSASVSSATPATRAAKRAEVASPSSPSASVHRTPRHSTPARLRRAAAPAWSGEGARGNPAATSGGEATPAREQRAVALSDGGVAAASPGVAPYL